MALTKKQARQIATAVVVVVVAGVLALTVRFGNDGSSVVPTSPHSDPAFAGCAIAPEVDPAKTGARNVAELVAAAMSESAMALGVPDLPRLEELVSRRVELILAPDFERWANVVREEGGSLNLPSDDHEQEQFRSGWRHQARALEMSPVAPSGVVVRRVASPVSVPATEPGTLFVSSSARDKGGEYVVGDSDAQTIEVLIPMQFRAEDGVNIPCVAGIRLSHTRGGWVPVDLYVFFDERGFGRPLTSPVF